jgi:hypothetical protein
VPGQGEILVGEKSGLAHHSRIFQTDEFLAGIQGECFGSRLAFVLFRQKTRQL